MQVEDRGQILRWRVLVRGIVQGVGFRPFVFGLAHRLGLTGFVRNDSTGVTIEIEGPLAGLERFVAALRDEAPPLARIETLERAVLLPRGDSSFAIVASAATTTRRTLIAPDCATCPDCLRELRDPTDRRYGYPFINCTNCGPRFTIVLDIPYDRDRTTMRQFVLCPACRAEYENPLDRRFHAQPNACPVCGPRLQWEELAGSWPGAGLPPLEAAAAALAAGAIVAVKGLGGYHLACDALHPGAVTRLRQRKQREAKPFALMAPDLATVRRLCALSPAEEALLLSPRRPIVLLDRLPSAPVAPDVAPGHATLGLMLPYTPLHTLLLDAFAARRDPEHPAVLVLTSGNLSDEPIAYRDDDARARLGAIADAILSHNRPIHIRCDDSVTRVVAGGEQPLRRSRGYVPEPLRLDLAAPRPILAVGGHQKNTFCLFREREAVLSHHIGDLENLETLTSFREGIAHFERLFDIAPEVVAYDLHPEYLATREALALPIDIKIGVQHHHAHIASVLAEHGREGPVIGIAADGTGFGPDRAIWGGEVLLATLAEFTRLGHLAYVPLPGGDAAVRQPWRMALAYLWHAYGPDLATLDFLQSLDPVRAGLIIRMIERGLNSPPTSSMGRLFDAAAALVGLHSDVAYEGQAAIALEHIAEPAERGYPFSIVLEVPFRLDMRPAIRALVEDVRSGVGVGVIAGRFHATVATSLAAACRLARERTGLEVVALSGGVFQNRLLLERLLPRLAADGFETLINRRVPPNDGGLALGQAAVAAARLR
ncbi:MAG: carbamoyltransferase HypF [Chloroflexaceae bacterium]